MSKKDFIPRRDGDLNGYESNFLSKLDSHSEALGINPGLIEQVKADITEHRNSYSDMIYQRAQAKSATEKNLAGRNKAIDSMRRIANIIKSMKGYTADIGVDLQIVCPPVALEDQGTLKPELTYKVNAQIVLINFRKGQTDGIKLFSRRRGEDEFTMLSYSTKPPYVDDRPKLFEDQPEQREYYAQYFYDMVEIGLVSDKIKVTIP